MRTKICANCNKEKEHSEFSKHKSGLYGLTAFCNECIANINAKYKDTYPYKEIIRADLINRAKVKKECNKRYIAANRERITENRKKYHRTRDTHKDGARNTLRNSIRNGLTIKPDTCSMCNKHFSKSNIHGHHPDYDKPLDVVWVCSQCHGKIHAIASNTNTLFK